jgi:hypothetical protein
MQTKTTPKTKSTLFLLDEIKKVREREEKRRNCHLFN